MVFPCTRSLMHCNKKCRWYIEEKRGSSWKKSKMRGLYQCVLVSYSYKKIEIFAKSRLLVIQRLTPKPF